MFCVSNIAVLIYTLSFNNSFKKLPAISILKTAMNTSKAIACFIKFCSILNDKINRNGTKSLCVCSKKLLKLILLQQIVSLYMVR